MSSVTTDTVAVPLTPEAKAEIIAKSYQTILETIGENVERKGLLKTPMRAAKAMLTFSKGYAMDVKEVVNDALFEEESPDMVIVRNMDITSMCEHHLVPFVGKISIAYLPSGRVLGLSKFSRVAEIFARRLQVQERLGREIADALEEVLQPRGLAVHIVSSHMCMVMRGVEQRQSQTITTTFRGEFRQEPQLRNEFLMAINGR